MLEKLKIERHNISNMLRSQEADDYLNGAVPKTMPNQDYSVYVEDLRRLGPKNSLAT